MTEPDDSPLLTAIKRRRNLEEIRSIVEADPSLLRRRSSSYGRLPIHSAIVVGSPPGIVAYLLEQWPDSIRQRTNPAVIYGENLPVHLACETYNEEKANVRLLVEAWPESLGEKNGDGHLPVHRATSLELIQYLVGRRPQSVREPSRGGKILLHRAIEYSYPLPTIQFLLETWPESIRAKDNRGRTVLHFIYGGVSTEDIDYLLEQGGVDLLLEADNEGYLPLHRYLDADNADHVDEEIVRHLIERAPGSVRVRTKDGYLPLHVAVNQHSWDGPSPLGFVECLVNAWRQALEETTNNGFIPLHVAAKAGELDYVEYLVRERPESVQVKSTEGLLAVHLLLQHQPTDRFEVEYNQPILDMARFLLDQYPQSVHEATNEGLLPIHVVAQTGYGRHHGDAEEDGEDDDIEVEFFRYLVGLAPASVRAASNEFLFPFDYAIRGHFTSLPSVRFLTGQWPDVAGHCESNGRTPLHAASTQDHPRLDIVQFVAELRPQLLGTPDRDGSLPLHAAVAVLPRRDYLNSYSNPESIGYERLFLPDLVKSLDAVRYLAEQRPQSLAEGDNLGALPVHAALARDVQSVDMVRLLVELRPESLRAADHNGALPLHIAVAHSQPTVSVQRFPRIREIDRIEPSPSHEDIPRPTPPLDLVKFLVEQSPKSVRIKDLKGNLPLVVAASHDADLDVLFFLATKWPHAICGSRDRAGPPPSRPLKRVKWG